MKHKLFAIAALVATAVLSVSAGDYTIRRLKLNHTDAVYKCGEEVVVSGRLLKAGTPVTVELMFTGLCVAALLTALVFAGNSRRHPELGLDKPNR